MTARIDKLLADSGRWTRSEAKALVRAGRVSAGGRLVARGDERCDPEREALLVDGQPLRAGGTRCFMLHKPAGVLSATEDENQPTVLDLLPPELRRLGLRPVGRLDKDVTGLLLLTSDGALAHRLTSPKHRVPKRYRAEVEGVLTQEDVSAFREGLVLGDGTRCLPAELELAGPGSALVTVYEGKYHQVKRMLAARGCPVLRLHREAVGPLALDAALAPGQWRELDPAELALL
ncbi:MAG: 16S rRNA pseudouridine(516) synthase [Oscillospiraceae bacterium]|nr:16S rRNA pseudouridine(516) synthase [Oscillospiraceae bacterium]